MDVCVPPIKFIYLHLHVSYTILYKSSIKKEKNDDGIKKI